MSYRFPSTCHAPFTPIAAGVGTRNSACSSIIPHQPRRKEIHVSRENLSAHKTKGVEGFLAEHPHVHLHYTPTYSSWLNQVEQWLSKSERDVIARDIFTSVADLKRKLIRYIRNSNDSPKPMKWVQRTPTHGVATDSNDNDPIDSAFPSIVGCFRLWRTAHTTSGNIRVIADDALRAAYGRSALSRIASVTYAAASHVPGTGNPLHPRLCGPGGRGIQ